MEGCRLCPRDCDVDRKRGQRGVCQASGEGVMAARAALHMWEEPCISGETGSGTVFFAGCPLRCCYCQNYRLSRGEAGKRISTERLSEIFLELQEKAAFYIMSLSGGATWQKIWEIVYKRILRPMFQIDDI